MAIVQLSRITNRRGLAQDLPQLAPGEIGWCVDNRLLFIGNGTLDEGSPAIGNTEVLTEFSDIKRLVENIDGPVQFSIAGVRTLLDGQTIAGGVDTGFGFPTNAKTCIFDYQIVRNNKSRIGSMQITFDGSNVYYSDNYVEPPFTPPTDLGVTIFPKNVLGNNRLFYNTTFTGFNAALTGSIRYFT